MAAVQEWESVRVEGPDSAGVATLTLNRPALFNALNPALFRDLPAAVRALDLDPAVRVLVLAAAGRHFCSGIDLTHFSADFVPTSRTDKASCLGRQKEKFRRDVKAMQEAFNAFEECRKPVIAAIHGACIGGGIDMVTACDLRYCSEDAVFCVKEVDVAITADLGTLQRLPRLVGHGSAMELALTARKFDGAEARALGLVQGVLASKEALDAHVQSVARQIAAKSPLAVAGTKTVLLKARDMTVAQGLEFVALWNAAMLDSEDLHEALQAQMEPPVSTREENPELEVTKKMRGRVFLIDAPVGASVDAPVDAPVDVHIDVQVRAEEAPKRRVGRPKRPLRGKVEDSEAGRNWPDSEVFALIDIRGEMEPEFVKNAKKQGVDSWSNLHARMMASVQGFNRTPIACKRKFNSLYKQYKDDKMANNVSLECKFYECLDHWWHFNGRVMKHVSKNGTTVGSPNEDDGVGYEVRKLRRKAIDLT